MPHNPVTSRKLKSLRAKAYDPIDLEIQWSRLIAIMDEVDTTLVRTSFSSIVGEARDFAVIMLDRHGRSIAQSTFSDPAFTFTLPATTKHFLKLFPRSSLRPGDILITNDPWIGTGHLPDFSVIMPVFRRKQLVAFMATAAHMADMGGTQAWFDARDVFEEGIRVLPCKLYESGRPNKAVHDFIGANVRVPDQVLGDLAAIRSAELTGTKRLIEFLDDYGRDLDPLANAILGRTEQAMRDAIKRIPDGESDGDVTADGYEDIPLYIKAHISKRGDEIWIDFSGSSPEFIRGSINAPFSYAFADTGNMLKCSLLPDTPNNEGLYPPIHVFAPQGSVLNCRFPAAVKARSRTTFNIHNAVYAALVKLTPDLTQAGSGAFWAFTVNGASKDGHRFNVHAMPNGGKGALSDMDGLSTIAYPYNGSITPIEIIENVTPMLVEEKSFIPDSGGIGRHRGGLGQRYVLTVRSDLPLSISVRPDKVKFPAPGLAGGQGGSLGSFLINGTNGGSRSILTLSRGDSLTVNLPGGGGFGDPFTRDPQLILQDVLNGYVTIDGARKYGVVISGEPMAVDVHATSKLRSRPR